MEKLKLETLLNKFGTATEVRIVDTRLKEIYVGYLFRAFENLDQKTLDRYVVFITCYNKHIIEIVVE